MHIEAKGREGERDEGKGMRQKRERGGGEKESKEERFMSPCVHRYPLYLFLFHLFTFSKAHRYILASSSSVLLSTLNYHRNIYISLSLSKKMMEK